MLPLLDRRLPTRFVLAAIVLFGAMPTTGCDSTATIFPIRILFRELQVVSAYPAVRQANGSWERQCGAGAADGFLLNTAFISTQRASQSSDAGQVDADNSIRPGDVVNFRAVQGAGPEAIQLTNTSSFQINVDCLDPLPDSNSPPSDSTANCQGPSGSVQLDKVEFLELSDSRSTALKNGHNIMMIIDQSGSLQGLVDQNTELEGDPQQVGPNLPSDFGNFASDQANLRHTAAKSFIRTLNGEDRVGVLAFGEGLPGGSLAVPCALPDKPGDVDGDLTACFGRNHDLWTNQDGISSLGGGKNGRANLWEAVSKAYAFLVQNGDLTRSNHVVVLTDGPDTCTFSDAFTPCQSPCSTTDFADVLAQVEANQANPNGIDVRVHFVQFEARGYLGRDPRQLEMSCVTEGHYQFINTENMSNTQTEARLSAMEQAMANVRHSLMGWWQLALSSPPYNSNSAAPTGTVPGSLYGISGTVTLRAASKMIVSDVPVAFGVGKGEGASAATAWDRRPTLRKPCAAATDCGAAGESTDSCQVICSADTLLCPNGPTGVALPDTSPCTLSGGGGGQCCEGACAPNNQLCAACTN